MAKNEKSAKTEIPKFTIEKPATGAPAVGKMAIPKISVDLLSSTIQKLLEDAGEAGIEVTHVRGTLTLY